jgi:hypothetical protein
LSFGFRLHLGRSLMPLSFFRRPSMGLRHSPLAQSDLAADHDELEAAFANGDDDDEDGPVADAPRSVSPMASSADTRISVDEDDSDPVSDPLRPRPSPRRLSSSWAVTTLTRIRSPPPASPPRLPSRFPRFLRLFRLLLRGRVLPGFCLSASHRSATPGCSPAAVAVPRSAADWEMTACLPTSAPSPTAP